MSTADLFLIIFQVILTILFWLGVLLMIYFIITYLKLSIDDKKRNKDNYK